MHVFSGNYDEYIHEMQRKYSSVADKLTLLNRQKKEVHTKLMQEQQRASKSNAKGRKNVQNRKWTKMTGDLKMMKSEKSQGKKLKAMDQTKNDLTHQLADLSLHQGIIPKFFMRVRSLKRPYEYKFLMGLWGALLMPLIYRESLLVFRNVKV